MYTFSNMAAKILNVHVTQQNSPASTCQTINWLNLNKTAVNISWDFCDWLQRKQHTVEIQRLSFGNLREKETGSER